jgi:hypothetical protein
MCKGGNKMKKLFFGALLLTLIIAVSIPVMSRAEINISISLPPPIVFSAPPEMIVLPETYVYVVPDVEADIFFYDGWWWRPWEGRWYRSQYYDSGWAYYSSVPSFYIGISGWRNDYREHRWRGQQWDYQRIPHQQVQRNWKSWENNKHWEKQKTWGVQGLKPRTQSQTQSREVIKPTYRETVKPQSHEVTKPTYRETVKPQSREMTKPQSHEITKPQSRETAKPQHNQQQQEHHDKEK